MCVSALKSGGGGGHGSPAPPPGSVAYEVNETERKNGLRSKLSPRNASHFMNKLIRQKKVVRCHSGFVPPRQSSHGTNSLADTFRRKEFARVHIPPG